MKFSVKERQQQLTEQFPVWNPRTLDQMLDHATEQFPDRPYIVTSRRSFTYREIQEWSRRVAVGLVNLGVGPGDHVAVVMANFPEFVALKFAISRLGATSVPINFQNRRDELGFAVRQSDSVVLVTMDEFRGFDYLTALDELMPGWEKGAGGTNFPLLRHVVVFSTSGRATRPHAHSFEEMTSTDETQVPAIAKDPDSVSDIIYTSGTTGNPKGVLLTHEMVLRTAFASAYSRAFGDGHRVVFSGPLEHVSGYVEGLLTVLFVGGSNVILQAFDPRALLKAVEKHEADDALLVPTMTLDLLDVLERESFDLTSLKWLISSGGVSPATIWPRIMELFAPEELTTGYGMTETSGTTTLTRPDDPYECLLSTNGRFRDAGVAGDPELGGRLVVYKTVDIVTGRDQLRGEVGELCARGPGVTKGYYKRPEATAAAIDDDGWFHSGDLGFVDADDYLHLVGRVKDCYRCGAEQVVPKEVEDVLLEHPSVKQALVVPVRDERMGEVGVAWVVAKDDTSVDGQELIDFCSRRLARFKVPKYVLPIDAASIPTTAVGRPRKFLLVEMANKVLFGETQGR